MIKAIPITSIVLLFLSCEKIQNRMREHGVINQTHGKNLKVKGEE